MMKFLQTAMQRSGSLIFTPFFYGMVKLQTSIDNMWNWNKPGRNFTRFLTTLAGGYGGTYAGASAGAIAGTALPIPVLGNVIGAIIGGILGGFLGASVSAFLILKFVHGYASIAEPEENPKRIIEHTSANPDEYALSNSQYRAMMKAFPNQPSGEPHTMHKKFVAEVQTIHDKKEALGFWRHCYWTEEYATNRDLNGLKKAAFKDPIKTAETGLVEVGRHHWEFQVKAGTAPDDNQLDLVDQPRLGLAH